MHVILTDPAALHGFSGFDSLDADRPPILVVDDSPDSRRQVDPSVAQGSRRTVIYARNVRPPLEIVEPNEPSAGKTDPRLTGIDGLELVEIARFEVANEPKRLTTLVARLQEDLAAFGIGTESVRRRVGVAIEESLDNALYHGNLECSSNLRQEDERVFYQLANQRRELEPYRSRRIHVETHVSHDRAEISIQDEGPGFDIGTLDKLSDPDDLMRVGGRGMLLIRTFVDEVHHNASGNQITLIKRR